MKKNILITGGSGFLGINLALKLKKNLMYLLDLEIKKEIMTLVKKLIVRRFLLMLQI